MSNKNRKDYQITLDDAKLWTTIWRIANPDNAKAYLIPVQDLIDVLEEMGILVYDKTLKAYTLKPSKNQQDVRAYMAIDPHTDTDQSPEEKVLLVGTERVESPTGEVTYKDIIHYPKKKTGLGDGEDPEDPGSGIYDFTQPCPSACDPNSGLNG